MAQMIGFQDGIDWLVGWVRKISMGTVRYRKPADRPSSLEQWYGLEKFERTLRILKDDHDAGVVSPPPVPDPPPPPPPPPVAIRLAPMTHYKTDRADARYCVRSPGVTQTGPDSYRDEGNFTYTENGLCTSGGRTGQFVAGLKGSDSMDGLEPCDGYTKDGVTFPPWPAASYDR